MSIFGATEAATRTRRRRRPAPTAEQQIHLILPFTERDDIFSSDNERREIWEDHGQAIVQRRIEARPGRRPGAWWTYDSPAPRDDRMSEAEQLIRLGVVDDNELEAIKGCWASKEAEARESASESGPPVRQAMEEYQESCDWACVPKKQRTLTSAELARLIRGKKREDRHS